MHHRWALVPLLVCAVLACSDGGGSAKPASSAAPVTTTTPTSLTKTQFITNANALCAARNEQLSNIPPANDDPQLVAGVLQQSAAIVSRTLTELRKLPIPAGDEAAVNAYFAKLDQLLAQTSTLAAAYRAGDVPKATALQPQALQAQKDANAAANAYGLTDCGS